jgi:hypothetical protein
MELDALPRQGPHRSGVQKRRYMPGQRRALPLIALAACALCAEAGLNAAPPAVVSITPSPSEWVVDGGSVDTVAVTFDAPCRVPVGAIRARSDRSGPLTPIEIAPVDALTDTITVHLPPVSADRVTLIIDYTIVNAAGEALDGEIDDPGVPTLPSGDGAAGGQAVLQYTVIQGDVNRDGAVDVIDYAVLNSAFGTSDPRADLNGDGIVDQQDQDILLAGFGQRMPAVDPTPPHVVSIEPDAAPLPTLRVLVTFSELMDVTTVTATSMYLNDADGGLLMPSAPPQTVDALEFAFSFTQFSCDRDYAARVAGSAADMGGALLPLEPPHAIEVRDTSPPIIECPALTFVNSTTPDSIPPEDIAAHAELQAVLGSVSAEDECTEPGEIAMSEPLDAPVDGLRLGVNTLTFTATDGAGNTSECETVLIVVPAVPLEGPEGQEGPEGVAGLPGEDGADGIDCWDVNADGVADASEDRNGDGIVDVWDCQGATGPEGAEGQDGAPGEDGAPGPAGADGEQGPPGADGAAGSQGPPGPQGELGTTVVVGQPSSTDRTGAPRVQGPRLCGALGLVPALLLLMLALSSRRSIRRR